MGQKGGTMTRDISVRAMAAHLGVSKSQVARDKADGMPMHSVDAARAWRLENRDVSRSVDGRIDRDDLDEYADPPPGRNDDAARANGRDARPPVDPNAVDETDDVGTNEYRQHRTEREKLRVERERFEFERDRGLHISLADATRMAVTGYRTLRDNVLAVAVRIKDQLAAESDPFVVEQILEAELSAALNSVTEDRLLVDDDDEDEDEE